ncbi:hypothetical protein Poly24_12800 [Rosistilla carotiformis]|uniref:Uncharacterized protein n=1 Tax=Rosistilla carotiformis TaxID=2528017 RepID=A0A518JPV2_9BACT|nr:hypothetical protein Poly24_12800 [Rosistilla carotiformis]
MSFKSNMQAFTSWNSAVEQSSIAYNPPVFVKSANRASYSRKPQHPRNNWQTHSSTNNLPPALVASSPPTTFHVSPGRWACGSRKGLLTFQAYNA